MFFFFQKVVKLIEVSKPCEIPRRARASYLFSLLLPPILIKNLDLNLNAAEENAIQPHQAHANAF